MKKTIKKQAKADVLPRYDFSAGERGKYYRRYAKGANVVLLDPDVAKVFPTAVSVNEALRSLAQARASRAKAGSTRRRRAR